MFLENILHSLQGIYWIIIYSHPKTTDGDHLGCINVDRLFTRKNKSPSGSVIHARFQHQLLSDTVHAATMCNPDFQPSMMTSSKPSIDRSKIATRHIDDLGLVQKVVQQGLVSAEIGHQQEAINLDVGVFAVLPSTSAQVT